MHIERLICMLHLASIRDQAALLYHDLNSGEHTHPEAQRATLEINLNVSNCDICRLIPTPSTSTKVQSITIYPRSIIANPSIFIPSSFHNNSGNVSLDPSTR